MRRFAKIIGTVLPLALAGGALAEDVVIRIEAKRGQDATRQAAEIWAQQFPDVVTFPLTGDWFGIALGPLPRDEADGRLDRLKAERQVPHDSFIAEASGRQITVVSGGDDSTEAEADAAPSPSLFAPEALGASPAPAVTSATGDDRDESTAHQDATPEAGEAANAAKQAPPPDEYFILIESSADLERATDALTRHRTTLPDAGLWTQPGGRHVVALGPYAQPAAQGWLAALRRHDALPRDAFVAPAAEMGEVAIAGATPKPGIMTDPTQPATMPPLDELQRALRWAGAYSGAIDGKDGPMTRAAIAQEVILQRASPDTATAMQELLRRRDEWRADIGLDELRDAHTGLALPAPLDLLAFERNERALSIYGPKDGSGAALILFSQPGGQQEMLDLTGLVTALGWVPAPERRISRGGAVLTGRDDTHIGHAEARVADGRAEGFVLIWPASDAEGQARIAAEMADGFARFDAAGNDALFGAQADTQPSARTAAETAPEPQAAPTGQDTSR